MSATAPEQLAPLQPLDEHNRALLENVHPPHWINPTPDGRYNLVVIGAGTAGLVSAAGAAGLGARVALVERALMGGDCLNVGCVPSKTLLRSAKLMGELRDAARLGVRVPDGAAADFPAVMERVRRVRAGISPHDSARRFRDELGVDVFLGDARFVGSRAVEVAGTTLTFSRAVIATGARALVPPIEGLVETGFLTNETVFSLTELPSRLAVVGGGPIGCELAQAFRRLGAEVTILEMGRQFLPREDPDAAGLLRASLERDGVAIRLECRLTRVASTGAGKELTFEHNGSSETLVADEILVGVGRAPNVEGLGLEDAGIRADRQGVAVDDFLRTTNPRVYAAGDVCMAHKFTHAADFAARTVVQNALFSFGPFGRKRLSALTIPWCTYTDPEIAHVGLSEREAAERGIAIDTFVRQLADVDRARTDGEEDGFVKLHVRKGSDRILGGTVVARHAGELLGEVAVAMAAGLGLGRLASVIHPYPTQAEAIRQLGDAYNRTRLTPGVKRIFERILAWRR
jgi:pyruvate/2-oxoglutarate dehydrogenase complex dihydrolipoamide dehydrogenase (E3) component